MIKALFILLLLCIPTQLIAQLERRLVVQDRPVELTFMAPRNINILTTEPLSRGEMHYAIMHSFGELSNGWRNFYGIDNGAVIRFSLEYGIRDKASVYIGRSGLDKVFDAGFRYALIKQMQSGSPPVNISLTGSVGLNSAEYNFLGSREFTLYDRTSYYGALLISRKFSDDLSVQLSPQLARFNRTGFEIAIPGDAQWYFGLGVSARYRITGRLALTGQYIWSENSDSESFRNNVGIGLDIETGGHVFQLFFTTTQALNDAYVLAGRNGDPLDGGFRFGFNVNRLFMLHR
ncbi:MAG: hypothetical protein JJU41_10175 [Bacteroidetes bacterium]|nr:hypothetical protein [Bacteroidota bacterium]MCH8524336.1 DUF5777 family beta-barrel protein [Balneolales bacterium]